jgi:F-type H+-transporting ATPase subunit delta
MPLAEARPDALAQTYARSLFELVQAKGGQGAIESTLGELEDILELARSSPNLSEFFASPAVPAARRRESLKRMFKGRISDHTCHFLLVLNDKGRLAHLPSIAAAFDAMVQEHFGRVEVDVYTAGPISADELRAIKDRFQRAIGKEAIIHPYTDGSMLGGVKIRIGDRLIDGSVATQLRRMKEQLHSSGSAALRASTERIIDDDSR